MARDDDTIDPSRRSLFGLRPKPVKTREKMPDIPIADVAPEPNLPATVPEGPSPQTESFLQRASQAPAQNVSPKVQGLIGKVTQVPVDRRTLMRGAASVAVNASRVGQIAGKMLPKAAAPIEHAPLKEIVKSGPVYSRRALNQMIEDNLSQAFDDFADTHKRNPTEEEYQKIVKNISEAVEKNPYGHDDDSYADGPRYHPDNDPTMSLPGGENYREVLYKLEHKKEIKELPKGWTLHHEEGWGWQALHDNSVGYGSRGLTKEEAIAQALKGINRHENTFYSNAFDEPDILAHSRLTDRNIPGVGKTLHIEELGSEWHMEGEDKGYGEVRELPKGWTVEHKGRGWTVHDKDGLARHGFDGRSSETKEGAIRGVLKLLNRKVVPDAPLKETWSDEAMRRVVKRAIEEGYDAVSWTPGDYHKDRHLWSGKEHEKFVRDLYDTKMVKQAQEMAREFGGKVEYEMLPVGHPQDPNLTPEDYRKILHLGEEWEKRYKDAGRPSRLRFGYWGGRDSDPVMVKIDREMDKIREHSKRVMAEGKEGSFVPVLRLPKTGWKPQTSD